VFFANFPPDPTRIFVFKAAKKAFFILTYIIIRLDCGHMAKVRIQLKFVLK